MATNDELLALADELEAVSLKDDCESCLASGTGLCRGDLECAESAHKACAKRLREIVERDECEVTTVSAYDLLPDEDREALAWVREMGGVEAVKARTMPEGCEWPRFEDGGLVSWNDEYANGNGGVSPLHCVSLYADGRAMLGKGKTKVVLAPGERVKRPPVLAADGEPLEAGQTVWEVGAETTTPMTVIDVDSDLTRCEYTWTNGKVYRPCLPPDQLAHQRPVLDADGVPIKEGDEVWTLDGGGPYTVTEPDPEHMHARVTCNTHDGKLDWGFEAAYLTHTKPEQDSWERIEEDARLMPSEYTDRYRVGRIGFEAEDMKVDLVRRCRALAERGA